MFYSGLHNLCYQYILYAVSKLKFVLLFSSFFICTACVIQAPPRPDDPYYSPVIGPTDRKPLLESGSIYQDGFGLSLYGDQKAHRVGDIITIVLNERTVSSKSTSTSVTKDNEITFNEDSGGNTILGTNPTFNNLSLLSNLSQEREFEGEAAANQSNSLQGDITVTITGVLPNGNLSVRGEKWMTLNRGEEYIRISGMIRPQDVSQNNTVPSTKLANARITYSGTGELADSQQMGWLSKFFYSVFWPF